MACPMIRPSASNRRGKAAFEVFGRADHRQAEDNGKQHQKADAVERRRIAEFDQAGIDSVVFGKCQRAREQRHQRHHLLGVGPDPRQDHRRRGDQHHHQKRADSRAGHPGNHCFCTLDTDERDAMPRPCSNDIPHIMADCLNLAQFVPSFAGCGNRCLRLTVTAWRFRGEGVAGLNQSRDGSGAGSRQTQGTTQDVVVSRFFAARGVAERLPRLQPVVARLASAAAKCAIWSACAFRNAGRAVRRAT